MTEREKLMAVIWTVIIVLVIVWILSMSYRMPPGAIPAANSNVPAASY